MESSMKALWRALLAIIARYAEVLGGVIDGVLDASLNGLLGEVVYGAMHGVLDEVPYEMDLKIKSGSEVRLEGMVVSW